MSIFAYNVAEEKEEALGTERAGGYEEGAAAGIEFHVAWLLMKLIKYELLHYCGNVVSFRYEDMLYSSQ